jgi:hypothetical protein
VFHSLRSPASLRFNSESSLQEEADMFQGLRTVIYHVSDLDRAKAWYASVLGVEPYFDQPL